jgi:hypothetical protein
MPTAVLQRFCSMIRRPLVAGGRSRLAAPLWLVQVFWGVMLVAHLPAWLRVGGSVLDGGSLAAVGNLLLLSAVLLLSGVKLCRPTWARCEWSSRSAIAAALIVALLHVDTGESWLIVSLPPETTPIAVTCGVLGGLWLVSRLRSASRPSAPWPARYRWQHPVYARAHARPIRQGWVPRGPPTR